ncbi:MAG: hypothetical protein BWX68_02927 [Verrucomicrobia bacterium ADurb.Bin063]|nr:MAG: hypothetical protein BWX68_02927 [Verrucomicrobia bacterium ADurb.Bin063]
MPPRRPPRRPGRVQVKPSHIGPVGYPPLILARIPHLPAQRHAVVFPRPQQLLHLTALRITRPRIRPHFPKDPTLFPVVNPPPRPQPASHFHPQIVIHLVPRMIHPRTAPPARRVVLRRGTLQLRRRTARHRPPRQIARLKIILENNRPRQRQGGRQAGHAPVGIAHRHRIHPHIRHLYAAHRIAAVGRSRHRRPIQLPLVAERRTAPRAHTETRFAPDCHRLAHRLNQYLRRRINR